MLNELIISNSKMMELRLKEEDNEVTFVFGSAISKKENGIGIPEVAEITNILTKRIKDSSLTTEYSEFLEDNNISDSYQSLFTFIAQIYGQNEINKIIKSIVETNINTVSKKHQITKAINDFAKFVKIAQCKIVNIITTNFDTLIEEAFDANGIDYNSYSIVSDSYVNKNGNGKLNIIHIHGVWNRNDTMHTHSQLSITRNKIESSLQDYFTNTSVYIMAYGGWNDSFTRCLVEVVNKENIDYKIVWGFFAPSSDEIKRHQKCLLEKLRPAIDRERIHFFKGINVNIFFENMLKAKIQGNEQKKTIFINEKKNDFSPKEEIALQKNIDKLQGLNYIPFDKRMDYIDTRKKEQKFVKEKLLKERQVFIKTGLGYGLSDFIYSVAFCMNKDDYYLINIDLNKVTTEKQLKTKIKSEIGQDPANTIYQLSVNPNEKLFIHFKNLSNELDATAKKYLINFANLLLSSNENIICVFSSNLVIHEFKNLLIELKTLSLQETSLVLKNKFNDQNFTTSQLTELHELSEGVVTKLDQIINYLEKVSLQEVLEEKDNLFNNDDYFGEIPNSILKQIIKLKDEEIFLLVKILAVLKNGESLKNIRKSKIGLKFKIKDVSQIIDMGLARAIIIDNNSSIVKLEPLIKDYIISSMTEKEVFEISKEYLEHIIIKTTKGFKINSTNKKVLQGGFSAEDGNGDHLLLLTTKECIMTLKQYPVGEHEHNKARYQLKNLTYLSMGYLNALQNLSMYNETITACQSFSKVFTAEEYPKHYRYYEILASSFRMLGNYEEAQLNIEQCRLLCPPDDNTTLASLYIEELFLLEKTNPQKAIKLAQDKKKTFKRNSIAYIVSEQILSKEKNKQERIKILNSLYKKARKQGYHTIANNIILKLNSEKTIDEKMLFIQEILSTETTVYNQCRAIIQKYETYLKNNWFYKIKYNDIQQLLNVYNYLFKQRLDHLFKRCHDILWCIAEYERNKNILTILYFQGNIIWILNNDIKNVEKYKDKFMLIEI